MEEADIYLVPSVIAGIMALCAALGWAMPEIAKALRDESGDDQEQ